MGAPPSCRRRRASRLLAYRPCPTRSSTTAMQGTTTASTAWCSSGPRRSFPTAARRRTRGASGIPTRKWEQDGGLCSPHLPVSHTLVAGGSKRSFFVHRMGGVIEAKLFYCVPPAFFSNHYKGCSDPSHGQFSSTEG